MSKNNGFFKHIVWRGEVLCYDFVRLLMAPFSIDQVSWFGGKIFEKLGPKTSKHHIAKTGMKIAFPNKTEAELQTLLTQSWNQMGRSFAEFPLLGRIKVFGDKSRVKIIGLEHLKKIQSGQQGAVLVSGHFANWEIMAAVFSQAGLPVQVTYRPTNNPYFDKRIRQGRARYGIKLMVAKSGARGAKQLISALRSGQSIALLNDQKFNEGIEVPFFGVGAMTAQGPTRLALKTQSPIIMMTVKREAGVYFTVTIDPPLKLQKTGNTNDDIRAGVLQITNRIEDQIRRDPTGWFWVHRRWPKSIYKKPPN